ncbi:G2/mitotic-specific cyclin-B2-like [Cololabis saira]|uniref:G2/mitotic-specific cyclin-B2-like n=1 Tax=Cololabis saira TaxID=129043 RepID=UPI002AD3E038|nr:G2/mitotic-specific cyclin-B2-like [Cololabis saira]
MSMELHAVHPATENPHPRVLKGGPAAPAAGRAALGEISNLAAVNTLAVPKQKGVRKAVSRPAAQKKLVPVQAPKAPAEAPDQQDPQDLVPDPQALQADEGGLCQAFSHALLATVEDVDEHDAHLPELCADYVKDIYAYLHTLEVQQPIRPDYMQGYEITGRMRALLVDWLVQVHAKFQLLQETLYLTVALLDRFLQVCPTSRRRLQLAGVTAMLIACKYEEMYAPDVGDFSYITDNAFSKSQILKMEEQVLKSLHFQLGRPLPLHFLRRASKVAGADVETHTLSKYLLELTLLDYNMVHYRPSEVAAAALCLSQLLLRGRAWSSVQQHYSSYDEQHLKPIMQHMAKNVVMVNESKTNFLAVRNKYKSDKLLRISLVLQLKSSLIRNMAAPLLQD